MNVDRFFALHYLVIKANKKPLTTAHKTLKNCTPLYDIFLSLNQAWDSARARKNILNAKRTYDVTKKTVQLQIFNIMKMLKPMDVLLKVWWILRLQGFLKSVVILKNKYLNRDEKKW